MAAPVGLGSRFVAAGTVIALLITLFTFQTPAAWSYPTFQPMMDAIGQRYDAASDRATEWFDDVRGTERNDVRDAGSYTAFDDAFSIGGPLDLSDRPEVLVQTTTPQAPYLTARSYDLYTGRGWASTIDERFGGTETGEGRLAPELLFRGGQEVVITDNVSGARLEQSATVTPL